MARVRMRHYISGGRQVDLENHTFADWPPAGGILECGDQEAADLIRGGMADPVEDDAPDDGGFLPVPAATPAADAGTEPAGDEETPARPRPAQARTAPRVRTVKP